VPRGSMIGFLGGELDMLTITSAQFKSAEKP
jgi:hypothetical protein